MIFPTSPPARPASRLGLGLDLGTSGCRAVALAGTGQPLASARAALPPPRHPAPRAVEQDPADWWPAVLTVLRSLARDLERQGQLTADGAPRPIALAVAGTSASLLLATPDGQPLGPALLYSDSRAQAAAARIAAVAPPASPARGTTSGLAKLLYLAAARPTRPAPGWALSPADWIAGQLCGRHGASDWNNALKLGYDAAREVWPAWVRALVPAPLALPRVVAPGTPLGTLTPALAAALGWPPTVRILAGTTDSTAAALAAGLRAPGEALTVLGSTLVLKILATEPIAAPEYGVYSQRFGAHWLVGGASNSGGAVLRQFFDDATLARLSAAIDPERSSGLDYYPLPAPGERFPEADPERPPCLEPRPADPVQFLHGLLEGLARIEAAGYARLATLGAPRPTRILTSGGGADNPVWRRLRARSLGLTPQPAAETEAAYGAARLALLAA